MKKLKKLIAIALIASMSMTYFVGCSKQSAQTSGGKEETKSGEKVTLKFACWDYETMKYDKALIEEFKAKNPDIDVKVMDIPAKEYTDKMTVNLSANEDIDVFYAKDMSFYGGAIYKKQILQLDDLIKKDNLDVKGYSNNIDSLKYDGKLYGLPYRSDYWIVYYNKDIFDKMKVPYPKTGWTWEDYRTTAKQLTSGEGNKKIYGAYIHTWPGQYTLLGLQKTDKNIIDVDYNTFKEGFQFLYDMQNVDKSAADYATNVSTGAHYKGAFEKGNIGMMYMGTWAMQMFMQDKKDKKFDFNWEMAVLPVWKGMEQKTMSNPTPVLINAKTKHKEAAWKLTKFLGGKDGAKILANNFIMPGYVDKDIIGIFTNNSDLPKSAAEALKVNKTFSELPAHNLTGFTGKMITEEIQLMMTGNKKIDQGIKDMEKRRKEIIDQNK